MYELCNNAYVLVCSKKIVNDTYTPIYLKRHEIEVNILFWKLWTLSVLI